MSNTPAPSELKEYIVTLHRHEDLDEFYQDMETPGGNLYIPDRVVDVAIRRPISRNTHYWLTADEAAQVKQDSRVRDVELTPEELGLIPTPGWIDTNEYYSKDTVTTVNDRNWGLLRGFDKDHVSGWGSDGATKVRNSSLNSKLDGTNVDFVIYGYTIDVNAPEFAVNEDGTGGSRYFYVNWGDYGLGSTYTQASLTNTRDGAHETICASIAVGNTQGWARKARFTSIPYNTTYYDYVRAWHQAKSVNPQTGFKNPTVVSDSYGYNYGISPSSITSINYRGTTYNGPFTTSTDFSQYKLWLNNTGDTLYGQPNNRVVFSNRTTAQLSDIEDLVSAGVIFVGIAHNWRAYHDVPGGLDYNNTITWSGGTFYYNRGIYSSATGAIQVGAISDRANNTPSPRSGRGPRVDIWAPSRTTAISHYVGDNPDGTGLGYNGDVQTDPASQGYLPQIKNSRDPRNSNYYLVKTTDGTSFSTPQVAGVIGLWAELKPDITPAQALSFLQTYGDSTGVNSTSSNYGDWTSTAGATALALGFIAPTFAITANKSTVYNSETVTYTVNTINVPNGSTVYLTESGTAVAGDFVDNSSTFAVTINSNTGTLTRTVSSSFTGSKTSILKLRTGGYVGSIQTTATSINLKQPVSGGVSSSFNPPSPSTLAVYSWPLRLPTWPQVGFQEEIKMNILRTAMDKGIAKLRTNGVVQTVLKVSYILEDYQVLELENFIYNDIKGTLRFNYQHPRTFQNVEARVIPLNEKAYIDIGYKIDNYFTSNIVLQIMPNLNANINNPVFGEDTPGPYTWPSTLPQLPLREYGETGNLNIARTQDGMKQRRLGELPGTLRLSYILTGTQVETLVNFITVTLKGVRRFYFPHPRTGALEQVRLLDSNNTLLNISHIGTGSGTGGTYTKSTSYYTVNLNLEVIP